LGKHVVQANVLVRELMENCKFEESLVRDAPPSVVESLELPKIMEMASIECDLQSYWDI
jgi:hypothetical protein